MLSTKKTKRAKVSSFIYQLDGNKVQVNFNKRPSKNKKNKKEFVPKGLISFL
jgi:hypothetical protein